MYVHARFIASANSEILSNIVWKRNDLLFIADDKRSVEMNNDYTEEPPMPVIPIPEPEPLKEKPIPFNIDLHGHRYRRSHCDQEYVLFILDTSGSIGKTHFCRVNCFLGDLVQWFCNPISVATMTFSHTFHRELCFNTFRNGCDGRNSAKSVIKNIGYRGGSTHTGEAFNCAFLEMLINPICGFPLSWDCLNIVFITDGMSNGPLNACNVVNDFRREYGNVKIYSIGIGRVNETELRCLASDPDEDHLLQYPNFATFFEAMNDLYEDLQSNSPQGGGTFACTNIHGEDGTSSCRLQKDQC